MFSLGLPTVSMAAISGLDFPWELVWRAADTLSIIGGGIIIAVRLIKSASILEIAVQQQQEEISGLKIEMSKVGDILIKMAVQNTRLERLEEDVRELRHGQGFILPVKTLDDKK
jgi:hypothetical protein